LFNATSSWREEAALMSSAILVVFMITPITRCTAYLLGQMPVEQRHPVAAKLVVRPTQTVRE
jgi:hypothetical protein